MAKSVMMARIIMVMAATIIVTGSQVFLSLTMIELVKIGWMNF